MDVIAERARGRGFELGERVIGDRWVSQTCGEASSRPVLPGLDRTRARAFRVTIPRMADTYEPPRVEDRTDVAPMLIGAAIGSPNIDTNT